MSHTNQEWIENHYAEKHIQSAVKASMQSADVLKYIYMAADRLEQWAMSDSAYKSKELRKQALLEKMHSDDEDENKFVELIYKLLTIIVRNTFPTLNNVVAQLGLKHDALDRRNTLVLGCEVVAVVATTRLFDFERITIDDAYVYLCKPNYKLPQEVIDRINQTCYLPPLVSKPKKIKRNWDTPYYTYEGESLILGNSFNYHDGDICLDVINIQNQVQLSLSMDFVAVYDESEPDHQEKAKEEGKVLSEKQLEAAHKNWEKYKTQATFFITLLSGMGNRIWLGNRIDKRGRMYASGYHVTPQGSSYRKAILELHNEEHVDVPIEYRI